ncbi:MAG: nucleotidyltransferase family protein [Clostridia bacterium]|nr:nucleotidyltransferase family protein [Clostridia bacterium]
MDKKIYSIMSKEQQALCMMLSESLFNNLVVIDNNVDWKNLLRESKSQSVTPIVFGNLHYLDSIIQVPEEIKAEINKAVETKVMQNIRVRHSHGYLHKLMSDAGIKYCILKGVASAHYYSQPILRNMGDVDFYVDRKDVDAVKHLLFDEGFELDSDDGGEHGHHMVFRKKGMHLELHFEIAGIPKGDVGELIRGYCTDIIETASETTEEYVTYNNPDAFHHGLVMILHMQHHMTIEGIGLRHLCDWAVFVNSFKNNEFSELFKDKLSSVGLWRFAVIMSIVAAKLILMPEQRWMGEIEISDDTVEAIAEDIMLGGNFGRKQGSRKYESLTITVAGRDGKNKSKIVRMFESLNKIVVGHWPIVRKITFLYPVGWIYFVLRFFILLLVGKRNVPDFIGSFKGSDRRSEIYSKLGLFETKE